MLIVKLTVKKTGVVQWKEALRVSIIKRDVKVYEAEDALASHGQKYDRDVTIVELFTSSMVPIAHYC